MDDKLCFVVIVLWCCSGAALRGDVDCVGGKVDGPVLCSYHEADVIVAGSFIGIYGLSMVWMRGVVV